MILSKEINRVVLIFFLARMMKYFSLIPAINTNVKALILMKFPRFNRPLMTITKSINKVTPVITKASFG
jgi:hypothetical protein